MEQSSVLFSVWSMSCLLAMCPEAQELNGLDPTGTNVCSHTRRVTQYVMLEPLIELPLPLDRTEDLLNSERDFPDYNDYQEPQDMRVRPSSRVGIQTTTILVHVCCAGWTRNGTSCEIPICGYPCSRGRCVAPDTCLCNIGWTGPTCGDLCHQNGNLPACSCPAGLRGHGCLQPCEAGTYGENCRNSCACAEAECDPISGVCSERYLQGTTYPYVTYTEPTGTQTGWPITETTASGTMGSTVDVAVYPAKLAPLKKSGIKLTVSIICGLLALCFTLVVTRYFCSRWKRRTNFYRKQSCKRAILSDHTQSVDLEESIQVPERNITSSSTITQPNSYMYMSFNDQGGNATCSDVTIGHDITSLINSYATYTTRHTDQSEEPIYEVKLTSSDQMKLFTLDSRESGRSDSHYTEAESAIDVSPDSSPGMGASNSGETEGEYECPYGACKAPEDGQVCGATICTITEPTPSQGGLIPPLLSPTHRNHSSTSSSEDYCQADAIPIIKITEVPIDGTYTALIKHPEPEYSTTLLDLEDPDDPPCDMSDVVSYVTTVSPVSIKRPHPSPQPAVRRDTTDQTKLRKPPSARRLQLHQFTDVPTAEANESFPEPGSYVNDRIPVLAGKDGRVKRPIPAPRARLLPANLVENTEDMVP